MSKEFYLMIEGKKVYVTEEVYRAYKNPIWKEKKEKQRMMRCRGAKGKRCNGKCQRCEYFLKGGDTGSTLSLEGLSEAGAPDIADPFNVENAVIYKLMLKTLFEELEEFMPDHGREIAELMIAREKQKDIAEHLGIPVQTLQYKVKKISKFVIDFLDKNGMY